MHHLSSRGILLAVSCSVLLLTACTGYGPGGSSSGTRTGSLSGSGIAMARSSSSGPRFAAYLSSSSRSASSAPFFSIGRSSSSASSARSSTLVAMPVPDSPIPADAVKLFVEADRGEAHPGDTVYYTVTVKNMSQVTLRNFPVSYSFSPAQMSVLEADGAIYADRAEWLVDQLQPGQKRGLRLRTQLSSSLQGGDAIRGSAMAVLNGTSVSVQSPDIYVITAMPATGVGGFTGPLEDTERFLSPL